VRRDLRAIRQQGELRIGTEKGGDFLGLHFLHIGCIRFQHRIHSLELRLDLIPGKRLLRASMRCKTRNAQRTTAHCPRQEDINLAFKCHLRFRELVPFSRNPDIQSGQKEDAQQEVGH
jgi:hypothetical protein